MAGQAGGKARGLRFRRLLLSWGLGREPGYPFPYCITAWGSEDPKDGMEWAISVPPWERPSLTRGHAGPLQAGLSEVGGLGVLLLLLLDLSHSIPAPAFSLPLCPSMGRVGHLLLQKKPRASMACAPAPGPGLGWAMQLQMGTLRPSHRGCASWVTRSRTGRIRQQCTPDALPC